MDLYPLGLLDILRAYREGRATVQDYVTSLSGRIAALEPRIQAWEWFDASRAMADAARRCRLWLARPKPEPRREPVRKSDASSCVILAGLFGGPAI